MADETHPKPPARRPVVSEASMRELAIVQYLTGAPMWVVLEAAGRAGLRIDSDGVFLPRARMDRRRRCRCYVR
jgi:hypothetical protein